MTAAAERAWEEWRRATYGPVLSHDLATETSREDFAAGWRAAVKAAREACLRVERGVTPNKAAIGASLCADAVGRLA